MKKRALFLLSFSLLLTSCAEFTGKYPADYTKVYTLTSITPYEGRVRITDVQSSVQTFDTSVLLQVYKEVDKEEDFIADFNFSFHYYHALFDRYHDYSLDSSQIVNVKKINESFGKGQTLTIDPILFEALKEGVEFTKATDGLFNIAIGGLSTLWADQIAKAQSSNKYSDKSYELGRLVYDDPIEETISRATVCVPSSDIIDDVIVLNEDNMTVTFNAFEGCDGITNKAEITLGALGKGMATELFAKQYKSLPLLINAGSSSVKTQNAKASGKAWNLQVANPLLYEKISIIGDASIAQNYFELNPSEVYISRKGNFNFSTSGYYNNYFVSNTTNELRSHIVNPNTGYSVTTFDAVSVFTDEAGYGDMYSTALSNTNSIQEAEALLEKLNSKFNQHAVAYYIVREEGKEVFYIPDSLKSTVLIRKASDMTYSLVSSIKYISDIK